MNWNQLKYVMTVAKEKNISKAARKLYISQPSLSISLGQLEKEVGAPLFERTGNSLELTHAGKMFCEWAETVLYSQNQLKERFLELNAGEKDRIIIGVSPHRSSVLTPAIVKAIHEKFPKCELQIIEKPNNELTGLLAEDKLDMMINVPDTDHLIYENEIIVEEEICVGVPKEWAKDLTVTPGKKWNEIMLKELKNAPFILLPEQSYFGRMSRQCLKDAGILPDVICECTFSETAKKLVESGAGVAFLPDILAETNARNKSGVRYYALKNMHVSRTIAIVYKKDKYHSEQFMEILRIFKKCFIDVYESAQS